MSIPHFDKPVATPISAISAAEPDQKGSASRLSALHLKHGDAPVTLRRTDGGRALSRARYRDAAASLITFGLQARTTEGMLYSAGIIAQAGLSSHLLDVGFDDDWCAKHIRHNIEKALACSNASGLGWERSEMQRLAEILSPYWKWNRVAIWHRGRPDDGGFAVDEVTILLLVLLDQVRAVTGHRAWR